MNGCKPSACTSPTRMPATAWAMNCGRWLCVITCCVAITCVTGKTAGSPTDLFTHPQKQATLSRLFCALGFMVFLMQLKLLVLKLQDGYAGSNTIENFKSANGDI